MSITLELRHLTCAACGSQWKTGFLKRAPLKILQDADCRCPNCQKDRFHAVVVRVIKGLDEEQRSFWSLSRSRATRVETEWRFQTIAGWEIVDNFTASTDQAVRWCTTLLKQKTAKIKRPQSEKIGSSSSQLGV